VHEKAHGSALLAELPNMEQVAGERMESVTVASEKKAESCADCHSSPELVSKWVHLWDRWAR
jgi:hypothetical protein